MRTGKGRRRAIGVLVLLIGLLALMPVQGGAAPEHAQRQEPTRWIVGLAQRGGPRRDVEPRARAAARDLLAPLSRVPGVYVAQFAPEQAHDAVAQLLADPAVRYVEPDILYHYQWEPNDPSLQYELWARTVNLPDAWSVATGQPGTVVAVVDSGVNPEHPDLRGKVLEGYDFLDNASDTHDGIGHGTAVAGIIAARGNDGIGIAGSAMDVSILPIKVGGGDGAPVSAIAQGIIYAVDHGATVINLSLGSDTPSATLEDAIKYAYDRDVAVVAAAGNRADSAMFPASYQQTISVGATTLDGSNVADFSSRISRVDLAAPGVNVFTTYWRGDSADSWASGTGTSFSTPIVTGTIALMRSVNPSLSIEQIRAALTGTARWTFPEGATGVGAGLLDAAAALRRALAPSFGATWEPGDRPVAAGAATRTWLWGPYAFSVAPENYIQTQHGERLVAYFDKARMEITNPYGDHASPWYVTNGLLVTEMISGNRQVGDNEFEPVGPAPIPVAGDPDDPNGPVYASFTGLLSAPALGEGATITQTIDRSGQVGDDARYAGYGVTAADFIPETGHRVASVFAAYLSSGGLVYDQGQYHDGPLFDPPFYATGYPITEAYWSRVKVNGQEQDVLVQCFERRCLTYTPANPEGWQVEMGNVGRHYYAWRFGQQPPAQPAADDPVALVGGR